MQTRISTGLSPSEHVWAAIEAPFPLDAERTPPDDLHYALRVVAEQKKGISAWRRSDMDHFKSLLAQCAAHKSTLDDTILLGETRG